MSMHPSPPRGSARAVPDDAHGARTEDLRQALAQKTALLHEIDHRVKNNLQLVSSLLQLQARRADDPAVRHALRAAQTRINAVAIVHRRLFQGEDAQAFDVAAFLRDMVDDAIGASGRADIRARLDLQPAELPAAQAAPLALLVSELLTNIVLHAFPGGVGGVVTVTLARDGERLRIEIADNGVGVATTGVSPGIGQTIVGHLCDQLRAESRSTDACPGVRTVLRLPLNGAR
ncbi:MAG TPA: sensor histidine kinase [Caulobacter sp.]|nr:sensor histidine kinase [Caulobacter sp.]